MRMLAKEGLRSNYLHRHNCVHLTLELLFRLVDSLLQLLILWGYWARLEFNIDAIGRLLTLLLIQLVDYLVDLMLLEHDQILF